MQYTVVCIFLSIINNQSLEYLQIDYRNRASLEIFKRKINSDTQRVSNHYYVGTRQLQILHSRLRTHCSLTLLIKKQIYKCPNHSLFSPCPEHNVKTNCWNLIKLHTMIQHIERKCDLQEPQLHFI